MNEHQRMVRAFMVEMDQPHPDRPTLDEFRRALRVDLIREEAREFAEAVEADDWAEMIDALCDLLYVTYGAAVEMGIDIAPFFAEVHRTNMEKAGGPKREDGKLLKPPDWEPPNIAGMLSDLLVKSEMDRPPPKSPGVMIDAVSMMDFKLPPRPPMKPVIVTNVVEKPVLVLSMADLHDYIPNAYMGDFPPQGIWLVPHPDG